MAIEHDTIVRVLIRDRVKLLAYLGTIIRDDHLAEDVFQEVSVLAVQKSGEIRDETHLIKWLRTTSRFRALTAIQKRKSGAMILDVAVLDLLEADWQQYDDLASGEMLEALQHCLGELSPYGRALIKHRYVDSFTGPALADAVGRKLETVYVALSRVHRTLAECIRRRVQEAEHG